MPCRRPKPAGPVARAGCCSFSRGPGRAINAAIVRRPSGDQTMQEAMSRAAFGVALGVLVMAGTAGIAVAETQVERGKYLVTVMGCSDCHTDGSFAGKPDMAHF